MRQVINVQTGLISLEEDAPATPLTSQQVADAEKAAAMIELAKVDAASVRAIREYIASKADAPQILKDRETLAAQLRAKLK